MSLPSSAAKPSTTQASILSFLQPRPTTRQQQAQAAPQLFAPPRPPPRPPSSTSPPPPPPTARPPPAATTTTTTTTTAPLPDIHPNATIRPISPTDLPALKRVNALLLPVPYGDSFYKAAVDPSASGPFSRLITWTDDSGPPNRGLLPATASRGQRQPPEPRVIGGIVCKVVSSNWVTSGGEATLPPAADDGKVLYIQSLCVLAPYRRLGLAAAALEDIIRKAAAEYPELRLAAICAHVWTENDDGLQWYRSCGFAMSEEPLEGYYHQLRPGSAWVARRDFHNPVPANVDIKSAIAANMGNGNVPASGPALPRGQSYQKTGPATEWNDLPEDMMAARFGARDTPASASSTSSRSSSTAGAGRKKRERAYPSAAFGQ